MRSNPHAGERGARDGNCPRRLKECAIVAAAVEVVAVAAVVVGVVVVKL